MDLLEIDTTTWKPVDDPIKFYDSLIWSERYFEDGDFELKTRAVDYTRSRMPLESCVAILQSKEVMIVEEHTIDTDDQGFETLTVKGRSLTSYTKYRTIGYKRIEQYPFAQLLTNLGAGLALIWDSLVNPNNWDSIRGVSAPYKSSKDHIPGLVVTDSTEDFDSGTEGSARKRWVVPGQVDPLIRKFFSLRPYGIRMMRPFRVGDGYPVLEHEFWEVSVTNAGVIQRTSRSTSDTLSIDVYRGADKSHTQSAVTPVILDTEIDDLILPNYVQTVMNHNSMAHIVTDSGVLLAYSPQNHPDDDQTPYDMSGLRRRKLFVDAGQPEDGFTASEWNTHSIDAAEETLAEMKRLFLIDGAVSPYSKRQYGTDYQLGDVVSVRSKYNPLARARVTEYIRVKNENGEESYPALTYI